MTREALIEAMAKAMAIADGYSEDWWPRWAEQVGRGLYYPKATAALTAIEASGAIVVPVTTDLRMNDAGAAAFKENRYENSWEAAEEIYAAMIEITPYRSAE